MSRAHEHHQPCRGGCGQLADECECARPNPLGSMTVTDPAPNPYVRWPELRRRCARCGEEGHAVDTCGRAA